MQTNQATLAPTTPGPGGRPNRTGGEPPLVGLAPLAFKLHWYARRRRHARMTTRGPAVMASVADAQEAA
jgi:hypothetical protein